MYRSTKGEFYDITSHKFGSDSYDKMRSVFANNLLFSANNEIIKKYRDEFEHNSIVNLLSFIASYYNSKTRVVLSIDEYEELATINSYLTFKHHSLEKLQIFTRECYSRAKNPQYTPKNCGSIFCDIPYVFNTIVSEESPDDEIGCYIKYNYICELCSSLDTYGTLRYRSILRRINRFIKLYSKSTVRENIELSHDIVNIREKYRDRTYVYLYLKYYCAEANRIDRRELYEIVEYIRNSPEDNDILYHLLDYYNNNNIYRGEFPCEKFEECYKSYAVESQKFQKMFGGNNSTIDSICREDYKLLANCNDKFPNYMVFGSKYYQKFCLRFDEFIAKYAPHDTDKDISYYYEKLHHHSTVSEIIRHASKNFKQFEETSRENLAKLINQYLSLTPGKDLRHDDVKYLTTIKVYLMDDDEYLTYFDEVYNRMTIEDYYRDDYIGKIYIPMSPEVYRKKLSLRRYFDD
jgi:hypothetical protein